MSSGEEFVTKDSPSHVYEGILDGYALQTLTYPPYHMVKLKLNTPSNDTTLFVSVELFNEHRIADYMGNNVRFVQRGNQVSFVPNPEDKNETLE